LVFDEKKSWHDHVTKFLTIVGEFSTYDEDMPEKEKVSRLIRSLPHSFNPLAMVSTLMDTGFDNIVSAVQAALARHSNPHNQDILYTPVQQAKLADYHTSYPRGRGRGRDRSRGRGRGRGAVRNNSHDGRVFHCCGKPGHFIKFCLIRLSDEKS